MAKPVADVFGENMGGFASDGSPVIGFSHLHDSGTGGVSLFPSYPLFVAAQFIKDWFHLRRASCILESRSSHFSGKALANLCCIVAIDGHFPYICSLQLSKFKP